MSRDFGAGSREWIGPTVIVLPYFPYSMDLEVLYLGVPSPTADLKPTSSHLLRIADACGFLPVGLLLTMSTLGEAPRTRLLTLGERSQAEVWDCAWRPYNQ
jgi:DHA2 family multidrug resistance protein-like MFS transporter